MVKLLLEKFLLEYKMLEYLQSPTIIQSTPSSHAKMIVYNEDIIPIPIHTTWKLVAGSYTHNPIITFGEHKAVSIVSNRRDSLVLTTEGRLLYKKGSDDEFFVKVVTCDTYLCAITENGKVYKLTENNVMERLSLSF